jgi:hypothetical protein
MGGRAEGPRGAGLSRGARLPGGAAFAAALAAALLSSFAPGVASDAAALAPHERVVISYDLPGDPALEPIREARLRDFRADDFANGHGTPLQRHYNPICLAYGFDPGRFADAVALSAMPASRAAGCALEYREALRAFRRLLGPHLDPQAAEAAFGRGDALLRAP